MTHASLTVSRPSIRDTRKRLPILFPLGVVQVSDEAKAQVELFELNHCVCCHQRGGFLRRGQCDDPDALRDQVLSAPSIVTRYRTQSGVVVRVTTNEDRSITHIDIEAE